MKKKLTGILYCPAFAGTGKSESTEETMPCLCGDGCRLWGSSFWAGCK